MYDVHMIRNDFPILSRLVNGKPLVYLDNGASAQKPRAVIDAMSHAYEQEYANVHRGLHWLSNTATDNYESVRAKIARFVNAASANEIVFTTGATEGINLISYGWAAPKLRPGDEIVLSIMEHHANIVPWHFLRERQGAVIKWAPVDEEGNFLIDEFENGLHYKTQEALWKFVIRAARKLNVQVFATTHSRDCIDAFGRAAKEDQDSVGVLTKLERIGEDVVAKQLYEDDIVIASQNLVEIR